MPPFQRYAKAGILLALLGCILLLLVDLSILIFVDVNLNGDHVSNSNTTNSKELTLPTQRKSFRQVFEAFPWADFEAAAAAEEKGLSVGRGHATTIEYSQLLVEELLYFLELEPLTPVNASCHPPPLLPPSVINCSSYPEAFGSSGIKRNKPSRIGALLQFGFDVDMLEVHLNELDGIVDRFFIIESVSAHYADGRLRKPLLWERVRLQERFRRFRVTHFILDDAESASQAPPTMTTRERRGIWGMEHFQEKRRWDKFLEWNSVHNFFGDDDIIGFGDADEIPARSKLQLLKYCHLAPPESGGGGGFLDFGIWFPFGHINQVYASDFPVRGHPLTLGDPTYYTLRRAKALAAKKPGFYPTRQRGGSRSFLLGGAHMSHYGYLPTRLVKETAATEGGLKTLKTVQRFSSYFKNGDGGNDADIRRMELDWAASPPVIRHRIRELDLTDPEMREICILPWFYDCNRERYPSWEDKHDTRLD